MFPKVNQVHFAHQRGSSLVMAIFIIVVMSVIGASLIRMSSTSSESFAYEVLGTRAHMAARIGVEYQLKQLFPLNNDVLNITSRHCNGNATNTTGDNFTSQSNSQNPLVDIETINGLKQCRIEKLTCEDFKHDGVTYYTVQSTGQCDINGEVTSRTIEVEARSL